MSTGTAHTTAEVVAGNVRAEAARQGFNQMAIARALGQSQGAITKKWRGITRWSFDDLDGLAQLLDMSVADLVTPSGRHLLPRLDSNQQPSD